MNPVFRSAMLGTVFILSPFHSVKAENGALAYALPTDSIKIDGDLSDWPKLSEDYAIELSRGGPLQNYAGRFRVAYNSMEGHLYIGVTVQDSDHVSDNIENAFNFAAQDAHILMVDIDHSKSGSGPIPFIASDKRHEERAQSSGWDPKMNAPSGINVETAVSIKDGVTTYEWRLEFDRGIEAGRSIGLDHILIDVDEAGEGPSQVAYWGPHFSKTNKAGRLGDVVLLAPNEKMGQLQGQIGRNEDTKSLNAMGSPIRIEASDGRPLWVQVNTDEKGEFDIRLPIGDYSISSPVVLHKGPSKPGYVRSYNIRLDETYVAATVVENQLVTTPAIEWRTKPVPHFPSTGQILFDLGDEYKTNFDAVVKELMDYYQIAGTSIALVTNGEVSYSGEFGVRNAYTQQPVIDSTLFEAGSITKIAFAFAVNRMAERGEIDIDRPLVEYLPFEGASHDERHKLITARHVLSHTTGWPNWASLTPNNRMDIAFDPGTSFSYSGDGYEYLGRVVSKIQGRSIGEILESEFQMPMGQLGNTLFFDNGTVLDRIAYGHKNMQTEEPNQYGNVGVAYSMLTNAPALANFMTSLIRKDGLSKAGYKKMLQPQIDIPPTEADTLWPSEYGLGFRLTATPYGRAIGHTGTNDTNHSLFEYYEDQEAGIIVLTNSDAGREFFSAIRRYLLGLSD